MLATALTLVVTAALFGVLTPAQGTFVVQEEVSDMQQRMRAGYDALYDDLAAAGAGPGRRPDEGSLAFALAPILPFRSGLRGADPPATFKSDVITVVYAPPGATADHHSAADAGPQRRRDAQSRSWLSGWAIRCAASPRVWMS